MKKNKNIKINILFIIISSIIGITFSILFPLYQVPDELTHIDMIYEERNLNYNFLDVNDEYTGTENIIKNPDNRVQTSKYFDFNKKIDLDFEFKLPKLTIIRHFPQWIGMMLGEFFKVPVFVYITICELMALIFYIFVCNKAISLMPIKKELFMFIMLLPVCCQQMSSFSYDVVLNSFSFLFIAYIFNLKFNEEKINIKNILISFIILFVIGICKIPYITLGLLYLLLLDYKKLLKKLKEIKKVWIILGIIALNIFTLICLKFIININFVKILLASLSNPIDTLLMLCRTMINFIFGYAESIVGNLGWFDVKISRLFVVFVYTILLILTFMNFKKQEDKAKCKFSKKDKIIIFITILILIYVIVLSMFSWTLYINKIPNYNNLSISKYAYYLKNTKYIVGVQGRYFIPIIPLILVPIQYKKNIKNFNLNIILILYYVIFYIYYFVVLLNRYWI